MKPHDTGTPGLTVALATTLPAVIALVVLVVLALFGVIHWAVPIGVACALAILTAYNHLRSARVRRESS